MKVWPGAGSLVATGGKLALTVFRLIAVIFGVYYINSIVQKKYHRGFILCVSMIFAGALGNLIDSMFYGMIFSGSNDGAGLWLLCSLPVAAMPVSCMVKWLI